jgi:hypothetical protein
MLKALKQQYGHKEDMFRQPSPHRCLRTHGIPVRKKHPLLIEIQAHEFLGPLGNGFPLRRIEPGKTALLVGGGVGVPPLQELSKRLTEKGVNVIHPGQKTRSLTVSSVDNGYFIRGEINVRNAERSS